jgi:hypothetical protein
MEDLWGPIQRDKWRNTPCTMGRVANEDDVREGRAVFYVASPSLAADMVLPRYGLLREGDTEPLPVVLIQAERRDDGEVIVGYRPLAGGNGICFLKELELLDDPEAASR